MASGKQKEIKCFNFIWNIENASYFWLKGHDFIVSPCFVEDEIDETKWTLRIFPCHNVNTGEVNNFRLFLFREEDSKGAESIPIEWQFALLALDNTVLYSCSRRKDDFRKGDCKPRGVLDLSGEVVFVKSIPEFQPENTLTVRCRIWKSASELSEEIQCVARTHIQVEKRSFLWKVGYFRNLESEEKTTYEIKSVKTGEQIITLNLFLTDGSDSDKIRLDIIPKGTEIKICRLEISPIDAFGNTGECLKGEFQFLELQESKQFSLSFSKSKLMKKSEFLSFRCHCSFSKGVVVNEIERVVSGEIAFENRETKNSCSDRENARLKNILNDDFKSMLNQRILSDIELRSSCKTYSAHKCILGARSPVFKAMFSNDMKEKTDDYIDIEDLNDDTVYRMLLYIYSAEVELLEWRSAIDLYEASDKYEILALRDVCSTYLKNNLRQNNPCEALLLADLYQDEGLKSFVQDFIVNQGNDIVFSKEWDHLMETNLKLSVDTMRLKFKENTDR